MIQQQSPIERETVWEIPSHESLLAMRVLAGDQEAFTHFVKYYSGPLYNYIYHVLQDAELSADILQNVFTRFYTFLPQMNLDKPFKPWLFQVAHNFCIDEIRSKRRRMTQTFSTLIIMDEETNTEGILDIEDPKSSIEEICERHDMQTSIRRALKALSLKARNVVILRCTSNMTFSQIGQALDMPEQTAKTYFCRARKILRQELLKDEIIQR
ncbi:RNA polymerase sigma factor [Dictyobacter sp. S3.2.2.5]|uniref:RNA polymerase sigma factor n=1 Tax=Dictyobacter halimunensis TaxID=3026934 RepID=A0ABQ6FU16_9CHLR|nr:RNA polymerase sigma factor [Dictyobacter sp. S3.2.2.5]